MDFCVQDACVEVHGASLECASTRLEAFLAFFCMLDPALEKPLPLIQVQILVQGARLFVLVDNGADSGVLHTELNRNLCGRKLVIYVKVHDLQALVERQALVVGSHLCFKILLGVVWTLVFILSVNNILFDGNLLFFVLFVLINRTIGISTLVLGADSLLRFLNLMSTTLLLAFEVVNSLKTHAVIRLPDNPFQRVRILAQSVVHDLFHN